MTKRAKIRNDMILAAVILAIAAAGFLFYTVNRQPGAFAAVKIDGEVTGLYPLSEDAEIEIVTGESGEFRNVLSIRDGKASITQADCPDMICVKTRAASYTGETIVCLPHKLVIEIVAQDGAAQIDAAA